MIIIRALYLSEQHLRMFKNKDLTAYVTATVTAGQSLNKQIESDEIRRPSRSHLMSSRSMNEALFYDERKRQM
jgi:hypothetical protein